MLRFQETPSSTSATKPDAAARELALVFAVDKPTSRGAGMDFYVLKVESSDGAVTDSVPKGGPSAWKYFEGMPLAAEFPKGAFIPFARNFPQARALVDFQPSLEGLVIISNKTRQVIEALGVNNAEFLEVAMKDHKKKLVATDYAILNLLGAEEAIDMERSKYRMSRLDKEQIDRVENLVLAPKKIRPEAKLFRCATFRHLILVRSDVKQAFEKAGLTGLRLPLAEGYDSL
jgi:hypothetical protein